MSQQLEPIFLSLFLAASTSVILLLVANLFSYWIFFSRNILGGILRVLTNLPLVLPPTVLGFYFLILFSPRSGIGQFLEPLGISLVFSFEGLVLASVVFGLPFMVNPLLASLEGIPGSFVELGVVAQRSKWTIYRKLLFPHLREGLVAGFMMSFAHTLGEFGLILMIGGNIQGRTRVASIEIYNQVISMNYEQAHSLSLIMVLISAIILGTVFYWFKRNRTRVVW